ncbi:MAG: DUF4381 family protein [Gammaproteobacteria bacterium]|nr:DUF4381 family protein [Gammaproteobacteria bacterium]
MNDAETLNRLADIELPAAPDWQPLVIAVAVIATLTVILIAARLVWRARRRRADDRQTATPLAMAQTRLEQTRRDWQVGEIDDREAAYQLATLLRLGLGLPQLPHEYPAHIPVAPSEWQEITQLLERLRYQQTSQERLSPEMFQLLGRWLAARNEE